jgi:hypothetical protein
VTRWLPIFLAIISTGIVLIARFVTNRRINASRERLAKEYLRTTQNAGEIGKKMDSLLEIQEELLKNRSPEGVPPLELALLFPGLLGLIVSFIWAFLSIGWWASGIVVVLYLLPTGIFPTALARRK